MPSVSGTRIRITVTAVDERGEYVAPGVRRTFDLLPGGRCSGTSIGRMVERLVRFIEADFADVEAAASAPRPGAGEGER